MFTQKRDLLKCPKGENLFLLRVRSFLLRELVPSLIMLIIISICTSFVAEKIYQAKASRSHTITMIGEDAQPKSPSLQEELNTEGGRPN
jgi:uncharacterized membrane-anchored protein YitT (DUF2179 family)